MNWRQFFPILITLIALFCGFFSILLVLGEHANYMLSAQFIMLAMILDGLDGNLARFLNGTTSFGAELDTYVDLIAFAFAPAILIYQLAQRGLPFIGFTVSALVVFSGAIRLARFKVFNLEHGQMGYCGLPITANAAWVALMVFLQEIAWNDAFNLNYGPVSVLFLTGVLIMITLQVSNIRYPKPSKNLVLFLTSALLVFLLFVSVGNLAAKAAVVMLALTVWYVVGAPFFAKFLRHQLSSVSPAPVQSSNGY